MSNIKYVIRQQSFAYNDEYYDTRDPMKGNITAVYDDKSTAEEAYKQLIVMPYTKMNLVNSVS